MSARFTSDSFCHAGGSPHESKAQRRSDGASRPAKGTAGVGLAPAPAVPVSEPAEHVYRPDHYEPNYAYPLLVWLTGDEMPGMSLRSLMRHVSERNCFGLAVRPGAGLLAESIFEAVTTLRRQYHIHSERIYLAGQAEQAALALDLGLARPEWFAGIVALSPDLGGKLARLARFDDVHGKRIFLGTSETSPKMDEARRTRRLLWTAGMSVHAVTYDSLAGAEAGILRDINRWMIEAIEQSEDRTSDVPA